MPLDVNGADQPRDARVRVVRGVAKYRDDLSVNDDLRGLAAVAKPLLDGCGQVDLQRALNLIPVGLANDRQDLRDVSRLERQYFSFCH